MPSAVRTSRTRSAASSAAAASLAAGEGRIELDGTILRAEPDAILLRVIAQAIVAAVGAPARPVRFDRLEARILGDLRGALRQAGVPHGAAAPAENG